MKQFSSLLWVAVIAISFVISSCECCKDKFPTQHGQLTYFQEKVAQYDYFGIEKGDIVLIGDDFFDRGMWSDFYGKEVIKNRGIALEGTECTMYRIPKIAKSNPSKIFICTGLYDIKIGNSATETAENIIDIQKKAKKIAPKTEVYVLGLTADSAIVKKNLQDSIAKVNSILAHQDKGFNYIDIAPYLSDSTGVISKYYSFDGIRINGAGYEVIANALFPYIGLPCLNKREIQNLDEYRDLYITKYAKYSSHYKARLSIFNSLPKTEGEILILGNSLTNNCWWNEFLPFKTLNRGISGDIVEGVIDRIDNVIAQKPSKILLMIGVNDIINDTTVTPESICKSYKRLVEIIKRELPDTKLYVQSMLPLNPITPYYKGRNEKSIEINKFLQSNTSMGYEYLNIAPALMDENGDLSLKYTCDGIHLLPTGYLEWIKILNPIFND